MKTNKLTYILPAALLLAASCSQDEVSPKSGVPTDARISFRALLPTVTTRATQQNELEKFHVTCFNDSASVVKPYFLDKRFDKNASTGRFISNDPECIWPDNLSPLKFVAFTPSAAEMRESGGFADTDFRLTDVTVGEPLTAGFSLGSFKVARDIASQFDFVTSYATGTLDDSDVDNSLSLEFNHQLSSIELKTWGVNPSYDIEIAGVRLGCVVTEGDFTFATQSGGSFDISAGNWADTSLGTVEYIFRQGDTLVQLDHAGSLYSSADKATPMTGAGNDNSAMVIPFDEKAPAWEYKTNPNNSRNGLYFATLLRVTDATPYTQGDLLYPYADDATWIAGAATMEKVYLAVDKEDGKSVKARVYKNGEGYFTDPTHTVSYDTAAQGTEIKAFGWAALPVSAEWKSGLIYTYTLNYSDGIGVRMPTDPNPGTPIINDKVIVTTSINEWVAGGDEEFDVIRR